MESNEFYYELVQKVVLAFAGFGTFQLLKTLYGKYKKWNEYRKFPIKGTYYSTYEDEVKGKKVWEKALIEISQAGSSFYGETKTTDSASRSWEISDGRILLDRFLSGSYSQIVPGPPSVGSFFLDRIPGSVTIFKGTWTGWDAVNSKVASGKYYWYKLKPIKIEKVKSKDSFWPWSEKKLYDRAVGVLSANLGVSYVTSDTVGAMLEADESTLRAALDRESKNVLGAILVRVLSKEECNELDKRAPGLINLASQPKVGIVQSIAVHSNYRNQGVASQLLVEALRLIKGWNCTAVFASCWLPSIGKDNSVGIFTSAGFSLGVTIPNYWKYQSLKERYNCPSCGNPPCKCSAAFMVRYGP